MKPPKTPAAADLFQEGWSRVRGRRGTATGGAQAPDQRGSRALRRAGQMVRAAQGYRPAVFKVIRKGGCQSRAQLRNQLTYLTTKSTYVFDARGAYDGRAVLGPQEIQALAHRFAAHWDTSRDLRLGHTTHLLLSFPIGTRPEHVRGVVEGICAEFFQGEGAHFDYVAAVHTDRAHPHAHVVVNRESPDGERFTLRRDGPFSYQAFREAMVTHGDRYGLCLEATERLHRGVVAYAARDREVMRAREELRAPVERRRIGRDLDRALQEVALASSTYRGLAAEASRAGFEDVSEALQRASAVLARSGAILPKREIIMADNEASFDALLTEFSETVRRVEDRIAEARPAERPRLERGLNEVLASVAHLNPLGRESASLREAPSAVGLYARAPGTDTALERLDDPRVAAALDAALQGTGIAAAEVAARLRIGAPNAGLERQWIASDARAVAAEAGLDLSRPSDLERVIDRLDEVQGRIEEVLVREGVLRAAPAAVAGQEALPHEDAPLAARMARLRHAAPDARAFATPAEAQAFREEIDRRLNPEEVARLARGDEEALARLAPERIDRLTLGKAYLEANGTDLASRVSQKVVREISREQLDRKRQRLDHEPEGPVHE